MNNYSLQIRKIHAYKQLFNANKEHSSLNDLQTDTFYTPNQSQLVQKRHPASNNASNQSQFFVDRQSVTIKHA
jgi:hypothetical protein